MENLWDRAEELLIAGQPFVLATIIRTRGSVPREVGAKMVVPREGHPFGTIGGGCGEGEVLRRAYPLFEQNLPPRVVEVDLTGDFDQDEIQVCGGLMDVALDLWRSEEHRELVQALAEATRERRPAALLTAINPVDSLSASTICWHQKLLVAQSRGRDAHASRAACCRCCAHVHGVSVGRKT